MRATSWSRLTLRPTRWSCWPSRLSPQGDGSPGPGPQSRQSLLGPGPQSRQSWLGGSPGFCPAPPQFNSDPAWEDYDGRQRLPAAGPALWCWFPAPVDAGAVLGALLSNAKRVSRTRKCGLTSRHRHLLSWLSWLALWLL
jgi:hypothetical protein